MGAVVETNARFSRAGIAPVMAGALPGNVVPLVARHVYNQENTLRAALEEDRRLALTTFLNDPLVNLSPVDGERLLGEMLHATRAYLPAGLR